MFLLAAVVCKKVLGTFIFKIIQNYFQGLDFINILRTAFTPIAPQSTQSSCLYLFTLLGSIRVKAVLRTLMKLSPDV